MAWPPPNFERAVPHLRRLVRRLRQDFLAQLRQSAPRFLIETRGDKPWLRDAHAPGGFPDVSPP